MKEQGIRSLLTGRPRQDGKVAARLTSEQILTLNESTDFLHVDATIPERLYCIWHNIATQTNCKECSGPSSFQGMGRGYGKFCSKQCRIEYDRRTVRKRMQAGLMEKHGVENCSEIPDVVLKRSANNVEKYGAVSVLAFKKVREDGMLEKHGVSHPSHSKILMEKKAKTNQERYGVATNLQINSVVKLAKQSSLMARGRARRTYLTQKYNEIISAGEFTPLFKAEEYVGKHNTHKFKCNTCKKNFTHDLYNGPSSIVCRHCNPPCTSIAEKEVFAFVQSITTTAVANTRKIIPPYELDVYAPDEKVAIEFDGIYWHSAGKKSEEDVRRKHLEKTEMCAELGIKLIHIFENEWMEKRSICESIISNALGSTQTKLHARKCEVIELPAPEARKFLNDNHIQGTAPASVRIGLRFKGKIVSALTFGKSRYRNDCEWEIIRYASTLNTVVNGAFGRMFKHFIRSYLPESIVTYADRRFGNGDVYEKNGFALVGTTRPNYHWIVGTSLHSRLRYQKHKLSTILESFDDSLSEAENMYRHGYRRIWDCGSAVWFWKKNWGGSPSP